MKRYYHEFFTLAVLALCVASCKKSSTSTTTPTPTPGPTAVAFTYKVDGGAAITADSAVATLYNLSSGTRYMDVYVYKGGNEVLEFHFAPTTGSKNADTTLGSAALLTYMASPVMSFDSQSGNLNVTTCDTTGNKIEGDFNFVGKQYPYSTTTVTHAISEGHMIVTKVTHQ